MLAALALAVLLASALMAAAVAAAPASAAPAPAAPALTVAAAVLAVLAMLAAAVLLLAALLLAPALGLLTGRLLAASSGRGVGPRRAALSRRLFVHHLSYPLESFTPAHISSAPGNSPGHRASSALSA